MPERQRECLIGGITEEAAVAIVLHSNSAQAAGGGAFVACHETGAHTQPSFTAVFDYAPFPDIPQDHSHG
eukprot:1488548-Rhodomonas_salina.1